MGITYGKQPVKAVVSDVTATRDFTNEYQNTTGRPKLVIISVTLQRIAEVDNAHISGWVGAISGSLSEVTRSGFVSSGTVGQESWTMVFAVPNQEYYKVLATLGGTSTGVIVKWIEVEL